MFFSVFSIAENPAYFCNHITNRNTSRAFFAQGVEARCGSPQAEQAVAVAVAVQPAHAPQLEPGLGIALGVELYQLDPV